ncbi:MAG: hypothetical protein QOE09_1690 [Ilumatobacteraceae bacterium]|jgi:hypothetical protein
MADLFLFLDPWQIVGGAALLALIFVAVFLWNSPRPTS